MANVLSPCRLRGVLPTGFASSVVRGVGFQHSKLCSKQANSRPTSLDGRRDSNEPTSDRGHVFGALATTHSAIQTKDSKEPVRPSQRSGMSIFWVAMWAVKPDKTKEHDSEAIPRLLAHVKATHPRVVSTKTWVSPTYGKYLKPNRILMQEYTNFKSMGASDSREMTSECVDIWGWMRQLMIPRTFRTMIWEEARLRYDPSKSEIPLPFRNPKGKHGWI